MEKMYTIRKQRLQSEINDEMPAVAITIMQFA